MTFKLLDAYLSGIVAGGITAFLTADRVGGKIVFPRVPGSGIPFHTAVGIIAFSYDLVFKKEEYDF